MARYFQPTEDNHCILKPARKISYLGERSEPRENAQARGRSLARSRETRFARLNRRACSPAMYTWSSQTSLT